MHRSSLTTDRVLVTFATTQGEDICVRSNEDFSTAIVRCSAEGETPIVAGMIIEKDVFCLTASFVQEPGLSGFSDDFEFKLIRNVEVLLRGRVETLRDTDDAAFATLSARLLPPLIGVLPVSAHEQLELLQRFFVEPPTCFGAVATAGHQEPPDVSTAPKSARAGVASWLRQMRARTSL